MGDSVSNEQNNEEIIVMGDNHAPAPPKGGGEAVLLGDNHAPAPPADATSADSTAMPLGDEIRTMGDNHAPAPPRG